MQMYYFYVHLQDWAQTEVGAVHQVENSKLLVSLLNE